MNNASVLYVEDEEDYQWLVRRILGKAGLSVRVAESGVEGLAALKREAPDLLILDINLPDTDGYALCRRLRAQPAWNDLPILMLTVRRRPEEWLQGFSCGVDDYLSKPLNPPVLLERVQSCLAGRDRKKKPDADLREAEFLLTRAVVSGNRTAYEVLVQQYKERLFESLRATGSRETDAEDAVASALAKAYERLDQFHGRSSFYTWLYRISVNELHHQRRSARSVSMDQWTRGDETLMPKALAEPDPLREDFHQHVKQSQIQRAVSCVPRPYREMLRWRFVQGRSCRALARQLKIPKGTVMSRLFKARRLLQEAWGNMQK